ncbi:MAG: transposase [Pseudomonadota bacterium]
MACTCRQTAFPRPAVYRPRRPQQTDFYRLVEDNLETFLVQANDPFYAASPSVPPHAETAMRDFLSCGLPGDGFCRAVCRRCGRTLVISYSCQHRCPCPSCAAKKTAVAGAKLVDDVIPEVPVRMWTLTLPKRLRFFLDKDAKMLDGTGRILAGEVEMFLRRLAGIEDGRCGTVQFIQWGASFDLKRHVHYHQLSTDGVFLVGPGGSVNFQEVRPPTPEEVKAVEQRIAARVLKLFVRHDHLESSEAEKMKAWEFSGFSLDASVAVEADDRKGLEHLVRYCAKPSFVASNVTYLPDAEQVIYRLPKPDPQGCTQIELTPMECLQRIVELIPPPRKNMIRFYSAFAPNCSIRRKVVRYSEQEQLTILPSEEKKKTSRRKANLTWAALIRRVFEVDPLRCPCGGELKIVEFYTDGHECADYLERCGLPIQTADPKPARSPPELEELAEPEFEDYVEPDTPDEWYGIDPPFYED